MSGGSQKHSNMAYIWKDERWPDYGISIRVQGPTEVPEELYQRYLKVSEEYNAVQRELKKLFEEQGQKLTHAS
jgi:hypothetical protein